LKPSSSGPRCAAARRKTKRRECEYFFYCSPETVQTHYLADVAASLQVHTDVLGICYRGISEKGPAQSPLDDSCACFKMSSLSSRRI
jgi:hypothetical protein